MNTISPINHISSYYSTRISDNQDFINRENAEYFYATGFSVEEIAEIFNVEKSCIYEMLADEDSSAINTRLLYTHSLNRQTMRAFMPMINMGVKMKILFLANIKNKSAEDIVRPTGLDANSIRKFVRFSRSNEIKNPESIPQKLIDSNEVITRPKAKTKNKYLSSIPYNLYKTGLSVGQIRSSRYMNYRNEDIYNAILWNCSDENGVLNLEKLNTLENEHEENQARALNAYA